MSAPRRYRNTGDLPPVIPVFPLAGVVLLPRTRLPLNIFEPRYLAMIDTAMDQNRVIGMVQPRDAAEEKSRRPVFAQVGCAGRITEYSETDDGRYLVTLTGICRFHVASEREVSTPFRQIAADYALFAGDLQQTEDPPIARERLLHALKPYLTGRAMQTDWKSVEDAPAETLVNALSMLCPFASGEKQALLEAPGLKERSEVLIALLELANASATPAGGTQSIN
ncbi:MAG TPA: LON peptidase substrate-binding domain-containing protein [Micropepsaceae bacterium]|nr:LON peptidase substrate-binding domain-containing protein [Micropepsaceae bacterium]